MKRLNFSVHVGGEMSFAGVGSYKGGKIIKFGDVDCDLIGYFTLIAFAKDSGCTVKRMWYGLPGHSLSLVKEIYGDKEVIEMVDDCENGAKLNIYSEGDVDNLSEREESDFDPSEGNSEDLAERLTSLRNRSDSDKDEESEYEKSDDDLIDDDGVTTIGEKRKIMMSEYSEYDPHCDHKNIEFKSGLCFETPRQLHYAVQQYAICNGFNVHWKRSTEKNQEAICVKGCPWRLYASWMKQENTFIVKYVLNEHKCCRSMHNRQATTKWLAEQIMKGNIRRIGSTAREIQQEVMEKYTVEVPLMKCYKACWLAEKMVDGTIEEHFQYVHSYLAALRKKYPDSVFELVIDVSESVMQNTFKRLFICFDALVKGFLLGCRRFVGFDGTFIKHRVGGVLLTAVGRDGNDGMFPIAWAVVEGENNTSWTWFLELLFKVLGVGSGDGWTFVSDQQKGLLNSVANLAPDVEHRNCARHIYQNWKVKHKGLFLKSCFYKAVKSSNEAEFNIALREMRYGRDGCPGSIEATDDFLKQGPNHFCKAFFRTTSKCGTVNNNMCETFNSYIIAARRLPLIDMLERIRRLLMVRQVEKQRVIVRSHDVLCPNVRKDVEAMKENAGKFVVKPSLLEKFEVSLANIEKERFLVDLREKSCSCRYWDLYCVPCTHVIACINFMKRNVDDYVDDCYKISAYKKAYGHVLEPLEGPKFWPTDVREPVKPPPYKKLPGRPKKQNRRKSKEEDPKSSGNISKKGVGMKCSICGRWGHNRRTCKGEVLTSQPQPSDVESDVGRVGHITCKICGQIGHNRRTCKNMVSVSQESGQGNTSTQDREHLSVASELKSRAKQPVVRRTKISKK